MIDPFDPAYLPLKFPKGIFKARRATTRIVVHALDTYPDWKFDIREIDRWHREERGWKAIGYHFVMSREGIIVPGRPADVVGAHAEGWNSDSLSIALAGGKLRDLVMSSHPRGLLRFSDLYTDAQARMLDYFLNSALLLWPGAEVCGHNQSPKTNKLCPGFDVPAWFSGND